jgi:hypothetical protein
MKNNTYHNIKVPTLFRNLGNLTNIASVNPFPRAPMTQHALQIIAPATHHMEPMIELKRYTDLFYL